MTIKQITNKQTWEDFVLRHPQQNFLQSWHWGEAHETLGNKIYRLGIFDSYLRGVALLIKQEALRGSYFTCPAGPLLNWQNKTLFPFFVLKIKKIAIQENVKFIRIRPQLLKTFENQQLFKKSGFILAPMHLHAQETWQLDLSKSEEELLKNMDKDHRYEIRKAKKKGVEVLGLKDLTDVDLLYKMQLETARRHRFVPFSKKFLLAEFEAFLKNDNIVLFKAVWQGKPVAAAMVVYYGKEAVYHHAAATSLGRKASAAYLVLWEAIKEAKNRKAKQFNFWGVAPKDEQDHRYIKLNHFKKGFGGFGVDYLRAQDLPTKSSYWLTYIFETLRRKARRL